MVTIANGHWWARFDEVEQVVHKDGNKVTRIGDSKVYMPHRFVFIQRIDSPGRQFNIGDETMRLVFTPTGMTNISDLQAVFDRVEVVLAGRGAPIRLTPDVTIDPTEEVARKVNEVVVIDHVTGNAELDAGVPNHFDPNKRGLVRDDQAGPLRRFYVWP